MCGVGDPPPPPDYTGAANATAAGNADAARIAAQANRVNQIGPGGSITYSRNPNEFDVAGYNAAVQKAIQNHTALPNAATFGNQDSYNVTTTLSPEQQAIYNNKTKTDTELGNLALTGIGKAQGVLSNPELDLSGVTARTTNPGQISQDAILARLNPQIDRQREQLRTQLANQGIGMGNEAYRNAFADQNSRENDLLLGATTQGIGLDQASRAQGIQEQAFLQDRPLNLINALRSGTQVQGPQFQNVPQQATTSGPNVSQATNDLFNSQLNKYNSGVAQSNATTGGLFNLAGSLGSAAIQRYGQ
jgi:hypothetical protein